MRSPLFPTSPSACGLSPHLSYAPLPSMTVCHVLLDTLLVSIAVSSYVDVYFLLVQCCCFIFGFSDSLCCSHVSVFYLSPNFSGAPASFFPPLPLGAQFAVPPVPRSVTLIYQYIVLLHCSPDLLVPLICAGNVLGVNAEY